MYVNYFTEGHFPALEQEFIESVAKDLFSNERGLFSEYGTCRVVQPSFTAKFLIPSHLLHFFHAGKFAAYCFLHAKILGFEFTDSFAKCLLG
jgi:hypothetical protein